MGFGGGYQPGEDDPLDWQFSLPHIDRGSNTWCSNTHPFLFLACFRIDASGNNIGNLACLQGSARRRNSSSTSSLPEDSKRISRRELVKQKLLQ